MNKFASVFAYLILIVPNSLLVFDLKCSHRSHWIQRAKNICARHDFYHCLHDNNTKSWREKCFKPDDLTPGYHGVISGRLHVEPCEDNQFSPRTSWSNDGYECQYKKSICSEEGQIVVDNGSNTRDVKCRCDYRNGYAYIFKPQNECMCSPSVEDCSCHLVHCQDNKSILSQDYVCMAQEKNSTVMKCQTIENERKTDSNEDIKTKPSVTAFIDLNPRKFHLVCSILVVVFLIGICCICIVGYILYIPMESKSEEERILQNVTKLSMFSDLRDTLKKASLLVLTGRQGTGKTTIAKCLHGRYPKKKCIIIRIKKAELNYNSSQVNYIIVDSSEKVTAFDQSFRTYLKNIKATKLIIVAEDIPANLTTILKEFANQTDVMFDLNNKNFYNNRDKKNVLKLHMKLNNIYSENEMTQLQSIEDSEAVCVKNSLFDNLLSEETLLGFPKMCASLCSHKDHIRQGITYFRQPPALLVKEIDDLRENGKSDDISAIKYCLFVSVLLCNNMSLIFDLQSSITKSMRHLFPNRTVSCGINVIQTIAFHLMPRYFESNKIELKFSNPRIYQAVLITYCNTHPQPIFGKCNMDYILLFLHSPNYQPLKDEMVLTVDVKDTQLMQLIFNHIRRDQTYTHQFRLRFFHEFGEYARIFQNVELDAYCLAWEYICIKRRENEDELNIFKEHIFECSFAVIGNVLNTLVDKFGNTLLHYFVIWNGKVEKNIIDALLLSAKEEKEEQGLADVWKSSNLENVEKHTPLHFAVFFGRDNLLKNFKTMTGIAHSKETVFSSFYKHFCKMISNEKENLARLLQSGMEHVSEEIKNDRDLVIVFENGLIPSLSAIKFGKKVEFDHILSILQEGI